MLIQLLMQFAVPLTLLGLLWFNRFRNKREWLSAVLAFGSVLIFVFLTARWDWFSYYLRALMVFAFGVVCWRSYPGAGQLSASPIRPGQWQELVWYVVLFVCAGWFDVAALRAYFYSDDAIRLTSPFRTGIYCVGGGGSSPWLNAHRTDEALANDFALDIVRLNIFGNRATGLMPSSLSRYAIYGDEVHSPCAGKIISAVDDFPDQSPPDRDFVNPAGNHVIVECQGVKIVIAHLKEGSVRVKAGEWIAEGAILGHVGNSGSSSQPHLHIHAARGGTADGVLDGVGVPILLDGRFLVRNSLIGIF